MNKRHRIAAAIYGFAGALTTNPEPIIASATHDAAPMADRVKQFLDAQGLGHAEPFGSGQELSFGQKAAGCSFNPSGDADVAACKQEFAEIIDRMHGLRERATDPDVKRMASVAITEAQTAQMWAVKAITWKV